MKKLTTLLTIIALTLVINSCRKNEVSAIIDPTNPSETSKTITTVVAGKIIDLNGNALSGVQITIGNSILTTDNNGSFIVPKATLSEKNGFIKATKAGYFAGSRTITPKEKAVNNVTIMLIEKKETGSFANSSGGKIYLPNNGGSVEFPNNAVVTKNGSAFTGNVSVAAFYLDPSNKDLHLFMPGDLRGTATDNTEKYLQTFGMMAVELSDENGNPLQLATGKTAKLTVPITGSLQAAAPATIPLWYFDEIKGMWIEQGSATKVGNTYQGNVSHFTYWNCDLGLPTVTYEAKFVDANNNPLGNVWVAISRNVSSGNYYSDTRWGCTASDGTLTAIVPANENLDLYAYYWDGHCESNTFTQSIAPLTASINAGTFTITNPASNLITITGSVLNCSNQPVVNGFATIKISYYTYLAYIQNGSFSCNFYRCDGTTPVTATIDVFDIDNNQQNTTSIQKTITTGNFNLGQVNACGKLTSIKYTAILHDQNDAPLTDYFVQFWDNNGNWFPQSVSYNHDTIVAQIPANRAVIFYVYKNLGCGGQLQNIYNTTIAPLSADKDAGVIKINVSSFTPNIVTINGTALDCNNQPVVDGDAKLKDLNGNEYHTPIKNGSYSFSINRCSDNRPLDVSITLKDSASMQSNATPISLQVTSGTYNIGSKQACGLLTDIYYTALFNDQNGSPLNNFYVSIDGNYYYPIQNTNQIKVLLSTNQTHLLYVYAYSPCSGYMQVYKNTIGPFTSNTNAGIIVTGNLPQTNIITISGAVNDCNNNPVTNGMASFEVDGNYYSSLITNGFFSQTITRCVSTSTTTTINLVDNVNHQQISSPVTATVATTNVNIGTVKACGISTIEFFDYTFNSITTSADGDVYQSGTPATTYINTYDSSITSFNRINASFIGSNTGTYDLSLTLLNRTSSSSTTYSTDNTNKVTITITEYGSNGRYIAGSFTGNVKEVNGATILPISGTFRKRY